MDVNALADVFSALCSHDSQTRKDVNEELRLRQEELEKQKQLESELSWNGQPTQHDYTKSAAFLNALSNGQILCPGCRVEFMEINPGIVGCNNCGLHQL